MSSYISPFPNLTFKTVFAAALSHKYSYLSELIECQTIAVFAVTSTSFYNSSLQANVVSRLTIESENINLIELFLHPPTTTSTTTSSNLSTIQMSPVLHLSDIPRPHTLINSLKNSTYFSRSLKHLTVQNDKPDSLLVALENLVALEVLDLHFSHGIPTEKVQELAVISRLPSLIDLKLGFEEISADECGFFDFLGDLENNDGFRKLKVEFFSDNSHQNLKGNLARLFARNLLTHLALNYYFTDDDLDVLIDAKLTKLQSLALTSCSVASPSKIAGAVIACSSSLTSLEVDHISDSELIRCAEHLDKLVELRINSTRVNGSFLREKGNFFTSRLEILDVSCSQLSDVHLGDGFKYLTSLRKLDLSCSEYFDGASSLQHLTAAKSLGELNLSKITCSSLEAIGRLSQLRSLSVTTIGDDVKSDDVVHLKNLVNLRNLTSGWSTAAMYQGILKIAESFPKLDHVDLGCGVPHERTKPAFSLEQVTYLLEKCWPRVRHAQVEIADAPNVMPYLRRRFPQVDFGYAAERLVPVIRQISSSSSTSQVDDECDS